MGITGKEEMDRNYGHKRERVRIRRFGGKDGDKWDLLIMVEEYGIEWE